MTIKGIDFVQPISAETAKSIAAEGYCFAGRYLVPPSYAWKRLTRAEAEGITEAGMDIVSVFETTASRPEGGAVNGHADGQAAYVEAVGIDQPVGSAIYFTVGGSPCRSERVLWRRRMVEHERGRRIDDECARRGENH
ncbi:glycoside hydrolase domain-containing protein [Cohnella yongneupensis]|uniref:Glycoside hydrolase domain-containing protein n=1 Tax=Cohnella yongneupensis TaxID=425006 RepID=A0ABW0R5D8_9BACL